MSTRDSLERSSYECEYDDRVRRKFEVARKAGQSHLAVILARGAAAHLNTTQHPSASMRSWWLDLNVKLPSADT